MALLFRNPSDVSLSVDQPAQAALAAGTFSNLGANLSYTATLGDGTQLPSWMTFNKTNGALSISNASAVGSYDVLITARDANGTSAPAVENVTVTGAPAVQNPLPDRSYALGTSFSFSIPADTFTRAAGRTVSYDYNALAAIDSLTAGAFGSNYAQTFLSHLRGLYGDGGGGYQAFTNNPPMGSGRIATASAGVSYLAGPSANPGLEQYSINGQGINVAAASASDKFVWDPNAAWDTATVYYLQQPGGGRLTLQGAGAGAPVTVDTAGALGLRSVVVHSDRGQSNDQITVQGMTGHVTLFGADFRADQGGASFSNVAISGSSLTNWSNLNTSFRQSWFGALAPEAYLLDAGMNDRGVLFGSSYQTRIDGILDNFAAASPATDIVLIGPNDIGSSGQAYLDNYRSILSQEAANRGLIYVDDKAVLGSYATASAAGHMADQIHPNAAGNALRSAAYLRALGFDPNGPTAGASAFLRSGAPAGLTYSAALASGAALPSWLSFNPSSATFSTSGQAVAGTYAVTVRAAAASGQSTTDTFNLTVGSSGPGPSTGVEIVGDDTANPITGGTGDDTLRGNGGNDTINGAAGNDYISGGTGDDVLIGGPGADTIYGGTGADRFVFQSVADSASGSALDFIEFIAGDGDLIDLSAIDANTVLAGKQGFSFIGTSAFSGQAGQLRYQRGTLGGTQLVSADLNGDSQADLQFVVAASSLTAANFVLGSSGGGGGDVTPPVFQSATVNGTSLTLTYGETLDATNRPAAGAFAVQAGGSAVAVGGVGVANGTVTLTLASAVTAGQAVTVAYTDPTTGNDAAVIQDLAGNDAATLTARSVSNVTPGSAPGQTVNGGETAEAITGAAGNDTLRGNGGNDTINGAAGNDYISGGTGDDVLIGGPGADTVYGGAGADRFVFQSVADFGTGSALDFIEFIAGDGDRIDFSAIDANTGVAGIQPFTFIGTNAFSGQAGQLRYQRGTQAGTSLVSADLNGDAQADFQLTVGASTLTAANFV